MHDARAGITRVSFDMDENPRKQPFEFLTGETVPKTEERAN